jgi:hypothetical protein
MIPESLINKHLLEYEQWRDRTGAIEKDSRYDIEIKTILSRAIKDSYEIGTKVKKK